MYIKKLCLTSFRNFHSLEVELPGKFTILKGRNGQGKTNFLEAVYLLSHLRSPRTSKVRDLITKDTKEATVTGTIEDSYGELDLAVSLGRGRRRCAINGKSVTKVEDFVGRLVSVSFFPDELELVKGAPQGRRQFLLRHLIDVYPHLTSALFHYHRAMAQKNALLKSKHLDLREIASWNEILYREGCLVQKGLNSLVAGLSEPVAQIFADFSPQDGGLALGLETGAMFSDDPDEAAEQLQNILPRERLLERCLLGPHRTDLILELNGNPARSYASQGQCRSIVLALKLGIIQVIHSLRRDYPVVLLDDVESELDRERSERFYDVLTKGGCQILLTCTDKAFSHLEELPETHVLEVDNGTILGR